MYSLIHTNKTTFYSYNIAVFKQIFKYFTKTLEIFQCYKIKIFLICCLLTVIKDRKDILLVTTPLQKSALKLNKINAWS